MKEITLFIANIKNKLLIIENIIFISQINSYEIIELGFNKHDILFLI